MVLSALGVSWDVVLEDYLLSNHFRQEANEKLLGMIRGLAGSKDGDEPELSKIEGLLYVKAASLEAARAEIQTLHGDVASFLVEGLGCAREELERLRDDLLE